MTDNLSGLALQLVIEKFIFSFNLFNLTKNVFFGCKNFIFDKINLFFPSIDEILGKIFT